MIKYNNLKNNITIVLDENWNSSNEREGIPLLKQKKKKCIWAILLVIKILNVII